MEPESTSPPATSPAADPLLAPKARRRFIPGLWGWVALSVILGVLAVLILPLSHQTAEKSVQTLSLERAKQIGLSLKLFAADNDGNYPRLGLPEMLGAEPKDSNAAFAVLFPEYVTDETLFSNKLSTYQTHEPDNLYDNPYTGHPDKTLAPGENVYSYVAGLTDKSPPDSPLVADGTDGAGHYTTDRKKLGGVWEGKKAIIIHADDSGAVEMLAGPDNARYVPRHVGDSKDDKGNLLDVSGLGSGVRLLDPAVEGQARP